MLTVVGSAESKRNASLFLNELNFLDVEQLKIS